MSPHFPNRTASYTHHKSLVSHLNRMRSLINETPHVNIRDLLAQASQDLSLQINEGLPPRPSRSWLDQPQSAAELESLRSMLIIRGGEPSESRADYAASTSTLRGVTNPGLVSSHVNQTPQRVIHAQLPRADGSDPQKTGASPAARKKFYSTASPMEVGSTPEQSKVLANNFVRSEINVNGKFPELTPQQSVAPSAFENQTSSERSEPRHAWDKAAAEEALNERLLAVSRPVTTPTPTHSPEGSVCSDDDEGFISPTEDEAVDHRHEKQPSTPRTDHTNDEDLLYSASEYTNRTEQMLKYYIQKEELEGRNSWRYRNKRPKPTTVHARHRDCQISQRQTPILLESNLRVNVGPRTRPDGPRNLGQLYSGTTVRQPHPVPSWRPSEYYSQQRHRLEPQQTFVSGNNPLQPNTKSFTSPRRSQSAAVNAHIAMSAKEQGRSASSVDQLGRRMQGLRVVGTSFIGQ